MLPSIHHASTEQTASDSPDLTLYASLELSRATWLLTCLLPERDRMSKYSTPGGDGGALLGLLERMRARAQQLTGRPVKIVVIQEAGLDGFWVHRLLEANGIESHVVDPASIAVPRRRRRAKTDAIDGETLLRTLLAWTRGEPRVCAMVVPPTPEEEDRRRVCRERAILLQERIRHTNRIKGLLAGQGITDFSPLHKDRRQLLDAARTGDGRPLPLQLMLRPRARSSPGRRQRRPDPRSFFSSSSKASVRRSPQSFTSRASSEASAIAASWQPTRDSRQHRGGAARSTRSKAYPKRVIGVCVAP
jgi:transposase